MVMVTIPVRKVYIGDRKIRPIDPIINGDVNDSNTTYLTTSAFSWDWAAPWYWWTAHTNWDWLCSWPVEYGSGVQVWWASAPSTDPDWLSTWWCLWIYGAWGASIIYTQDVALDAGDYVMKFSYYRTADRSLNTNYCWVIIDGAGSYAWLPWRYWQWRENEVSFNVPSAQTVTVSMWYKANNVGAASQPVMFYDNISIEPAFT